MRAKVGIPETLENQPITYTYYGQDLQIGHSIRILRKYIKINILIYRPDWTIYYINTEYYPGQKLVKMTNARFNCLDPTVQDTTSLESPVWVAEQVQEYYKKHIDSNQLLLEISA